MCHYVGLPARKKVVPADSIIERKYFPRKPVYNKVGSSYQNNIDGLSVPQVRGKIQMSGPEGELSP